MRLVQCVYLGLGASSAPAAAQPIPAPPDRALPLWSPPAPAPAPPAADPPGSDAAPPAEPQASRWQISATVVGTVYSLHYTSSGLAAHGNYGSGTLSGGRFLRPVVDDAAPRSIQPFLQRAGSLYVSVAGEGFATRGPFGGQNRTDAGAGARAGLDVYLTRFLAVTGELGYAYDVLNQPGLTDKTHQFWASAGLGLRVADVRLDVGYTFRAHDTNGTFSPLRWGPIDLSVYAVFARRFTLGLNGNVKQDGGTGGADLGLYLDKDLGLFLGGSGGKIHYVDGPSAIQYGGYAGLSYWVTPGARLSAYYRLSFTKLPAEMVPEGPIEYDQVEHRLSLSASWRF